MAEFAQPTSQGDPSGALTSRTAKTVRDNETLTKTPTGVSLWQSAGNAAISAGLRARDAVSEGVSRLKSELFGNEPAGEPPLTEFELKWAEGHVLNDLHGPDGWKKHLASPQSARVLRLHGGISHELQDDIDFRNWKRAGGKASPALANPTSDVSKDKVAAPSEATALQNSATQEPEVTFDSESKCWIVSVAGRPIMAIQPLPDAKELHFTVNVNARGDVLVNAEGEVKLVPLARQGAPTAPSGGVLRYSGSEVLGFTSAEVPPTGAQGKKPQLADRFMENWSRNTSPKEQWKASKIGPPRIYYTKEMKEMDAVPTEFQVFDYIFPIPVASLGWHAGELISGETISGIPVDRADKAKEMATETATAVVMNAVGEKVIGGVVSGISNEMRAIGAAAPITEGLTKTAVRDSTRAADQTLTATVKDLSKSSAPEPRIPDVSDIHASEIPVEPTGKNPIIEGAAQQPTESPFKAASEVSESGISATEPSPIEASTEKWDADIEELQQALAKNEAELRKAKAVQQKCASEISRKQGELEAKLKNRSEYDQLKRSIEDLRQQQARAKTRGDNLSDARGKLSSQLTSSQGSRAAILERAKFLEPLVGEKPDQYARRVFNQQEGERFADYQRRLQSLRDQTGKVFGDEQSATQLATEYAQRLAPLEQRAKDVAFARSEAELALGKLENAKSELAKRKQELRKLLNGEATAADESARDSIQRAREAVISAEKKSVEADVAFTKRQIDVWHRDLGFSSTGEHGEYLLAEHLAKEENIRNIRPIQNESKHGIDLVGEAKDGTIHFYEVKSSTGKRAGKLSEYQKDLRAFVRSRLNEAVDSGWTSSSDAKRILEKLAGDCKVEYHFYQVTEVGSAKPQFKELPLGK